jgi:hypothetical protein
MRDHVMVMTEDRPSEVLGALPHTRPHRRSEKRAARPPGNGAVAAPEVPKAPEVPPAPEMPEPAETPKAAKAVTAKPTPPRRRAAAGKPSLRQPAQPAGTPPVAGPRKPTPASRTAVLATAAQAAAELAEIGLTLSARVLRNAVSRLPRP